MIRSRGVILMLVAVVTLVGCAGIEDAVVETSPTVAISNSKVSCGVNAYVNQSGACISEPILSSDVPTDATAKCKAQVDGRYWYSFSQTRQGTCSRFGGVLQWCERGKCNEP